MRTTSVAFTRWCENIAIAYRKKLGLSCLDALDPRRLADLLDIKIKVPADIPGLTADVLHQLLVLDHSSWSAVTLTFGTRSVIISNSSHSLARQRSNIAHELAHIILKHEPKTVFVSADGLMMLKDYDPKDEREAACLSTTLLVPKKALVEALTRHSSDVDTAAFFGVSVDLLRMRKNLTGAGRQVNQSSSANAAEKQEPS